jgi:hypothetical protein
MDSDNEDRLIVVSLLSEMFSIINCIMSFLTVVIVIDINMTHCQYKHYVQPKQGLLSFFIEKCILVCILKSGISVFL